MTESANVSSGKGRLWLAGGILLLLAVLLWRVWVWLAELPPVVLAPAPATIPVQAAPPPVDSAAESAESAPNPEASEESEVKQGGESDDDNP